MDSAVPDDHRENKRNDKLNQYLNLVEELKTLWNMKLTVMPTEDGVLGTVTTGMEKRLDELKNQDHLDHTIVKIG